MLYRMMMLALAATAAPAAADQLILLPLRIEAGDADLATQAALADLAEKAAGELAMGPIRRVSGPKDRLGARFVGADVLSALAEKHGATHVITGSIERAPANKEELLLQVSLWRVSPAERVGSFSETVKADALIAAAKKARIELSAPLAVGAPPPSEPPPEPSRAVVQAGAEAAAVSAAPRETENVPARALIISGGLAMALSGLVGAGTHLLFGAPLNDGTVRSGADAEDMLIASQTGAAAADVGLIIGAAALVTGGVLWLVGAGETEIDSSETAVAQAATEVQP